jgi:transposase
MKKLWKPYCLYKEVNYNAYHDQITVSSGKTSLANRQKCLASLFVSLFSPRFYSTSTVCYPGFKTVFKNRLSRYHSNAKRLLRSSQGHRPKEDTALFHPLLCRTEADKKRAFEDLLNRIFEQAKALSILKEHPMAAVDATGLESRHTSRYYVCRKGYKRFMRYEWPKVTAVCDCDTHLFAACIVTRGPSNDSPQFAPAILQASKFVNFESLVADAAYDGEHNHKICREQLGIKQTLIPLNKRRSRKWPKSKYRRQMKTQFDKEQFNQRWQIESAYSRNKRLLGSSLRGRTEHSRERECLLRILTHNLMILRRAA